ncbi:MAG: alpha/beta fold hydrolase [Candidatus Kariarchaeaceae archaeon]
MKIGTTFDHDYWKKYFDPECKIAHNYHTMDDDTKILVVMVTPQGYDEITRPVVLIPGWFSQPAGWIGVTKSVSRTTKLIYIETREKNSSYVVKAKETKMGIERMSQDIQEILNNLGIDITKSIFVASSLGGSALLHLLYVSEIKPYLTVLMSPNPDFKLPPIVGRLILLMPLFMIKWVKAYVKWHVLRFRIDPKKNPEQAEKYITTFDAADPWKARTSARHVTRFKAWEFLSKIEANVILAGATTDELHESKRTLNVGKMIENSRYIDFWSNIALHSEEFGNFLVDLAQNKEIDKLQIISNM